MFTGIVEEKRPLAAVEAGEEGMALVLDLGPRLIEGVEIGDSIALDGVCLTVEAIEDERVRFHAGRETLGLTTLGERRAGDAVNVERALRLGDKLGGHLVSGHVDGTAEVAEIRPEPSQTWMTFELPPGLSGRVLLKGSVTLDGVSLTITEVSGARISVALVPHTLAVTTLGERRVGERVNVEADMMGKWVRSIVDEALERHLSDRLGDGGSTRSGR